MTEENKSGLMNFVLFFGILLLVSAGSFLGGAALAYQDSISNDWIFAHAAAERFAENHNYSKEYNCKNYSVDFMRTMENLGIYVDVVGGCNESMNCHAWNTIRLHIEPQSGDVTPNPKEYPGTMSPYDLKLALLGVE